jgi:hypothetical protein
MIMKTKGKECNHMKQKRVLTALLLASMLLPDVPEVGMIQRYSVERRQIKIVSFLYNSKCTGG